MGTLIELPMLTAADEWTAAAVRAEIARQRIKQTALAAEIGVPQQWLNVRVNGLRAFSPGLLTAVAKCLGRPVSDFMPPIDSGLSGPLAQLAELRTFNPYSECAA